MSDFTLSQYRDPSGYYNVLHGTLLVGFIKWDPFDRLWRVWCRWDRCNELGQSRRKSSGLELVTDHALREHR